MVEEMLAYHAGKGHPRKIELFSIALKNPEDKLLGCIVVSFLWNGMHIDSLWVDESMRGKDYGTRLMEIAEKEAITRGCAIAYTDTFTWQAPSFYEKLGYIIYEKLEGFPEGSSLSYYLKKDYSK